LIFEFLCDWGSILFNFSNFCFQRHFFIYQNFNTNFTTLKAIDAMISELFEFLKNLNRSLSYYKNKIRQKKFDKLILAKKFAIFLFSLAVSLFVNGFLRFAMRWKALRKSFPTHCVSRKSAHKQRHDERKRLRGHPCTLKYMPDTMG